MKVTVPVDCHVRLEVRAFYRSNKERWLQQKLKDAENVVDQIKRHVDDVFDIHVVTEYKSECSHCGSLWTEDSTTYNGGCCATDEENHELAVRQGATT